MLDVSHSRRKFDLEKELIWHTCDTSEIMRSSLRLTKCVTYQKIIREVAGLGSG
jgi:hypothetical protein